MNTDKAGQASPEFTPTVKHDVAARRFEVTADGFNSVLNYLSDTGGMTITHTFVPSELRGRGVAELLTRAALDFARAEHLRVTPQCSYAARFIERHREYQDLL